MNKFVLMPELSGMRAMKPDNCFLKIFLSFPPWANAFYCTSEFALANKALIDILDENRINIKMDTIEGLGANTLILTEMSQKFIPCDTFKEHIGQLRQQRAKFLFYVDETEELGYAPSADEFMFYTSEKQMFFSMHMTTSYGPDEQGEPEVGITQNGGQGVAVGLWRDSDILQGRNENRKVLRQLLQEKTGHMFAENLPLLVHFMTYHHDVPIFNRNMLRLSEKASILIKSMNFEGHIVDTVSMPPEGGNIFHYSKTQHLNYLMRYAADAVLAGAFTGVFTTSVMLGSRVIPIYTQKIYPWFSYQKINQSTSFTWHMGSRLMSLPAGLLDCLTPICIESIDMLMDRINDQAYWERYEELLPEIQKYAFGRFLLGEAAMNRAKGFIARFINHGSFMLPEHLADPNKRVQTNTGSLLLQRKPFSPF